MSGCVQYTAAWMHALRSVDLLAGYQSHQCCCYIRIGTLLSTIVHGTSKHISRVIDESSVTSAPFNLPQSER